MFCFYFHPLFVQTQAHLCKQWHGEILWTYVIIITINKTFLEFVDVDVGFWYSPCELNCFVFYFSLSSKSRYAMKAKLINWIELFEHKQWRYYSAFVGQNNKFWIDRVHDALDRQNHTLKSNKKQSACNQCTSNFCSFQIFSIECVTIPTARIHTHISSFYSTLLIICIVSFLWFTIVT